MRTLLPIIFLVNLFIYHNTLLGQCPDRVSFLTITSSPESKKAEKLSELLKYESVINCLRPTDSLKGLLYRVISRNYALNNEFDLAISYLRKAVREFRSVPEPKISAAYIAYCYYLLQVYYDSIGLRSKCIEAIDSCIATEKFASDYKYTCFLIERKVYWLFNKGDYQLCIASADFGESIIRHYRKSPDTLSRFLYLLTYKVQSLLRLNNLTEATRLVQTRIQQLVRSGGHNYLGLMYGLLAEINNQSHQRDMEAVYNSKSFLANKRDGYRKGCAESLISIATTFDEDFDKRDSAKIYLQAAFEYADRVDSVHIYNLLANLCVKRNQFAQAKRLYSRAFESISPGISEDNLKQLSVEQTATTNLVSYITQLLIDKADAHLKEFKFSGDPQSLQNAIRATRYADEFAWSIKQNILETESNLSWRNRVRRLYEIGIEACYIARNMDDAFNFFENSKSVLLDDQIESQRGMSEADIIKQADLETQKQSLQLQLSKLVPATTEYLDVQKKIYSNNTDREQLRRRADRLNTVQAPANAFQNVNTFRNEMLRNHQALIELFVGDSAVYTLQILKNEVRLERIDKTVYEALTASFLSHLVRPSFSTVDFDRFVIIAHNLYKQIFKTGDIPPGRIIISPDGTNFPFEALISSVNGSDIKYFVQRYAVSYTYSARFLLSNHSDSEDRSAGFMGVAPVVYKNYSVLSPLIGSDISLKAISDDFDQAETFIFQKATRSNFLENFSRYKIVHLYSHASAKNPDEPVLYFADSALYLKDLVFRRKPVTSLIVLAACESGVGKLYSGEGIFSFNRAFAGVGVPAALVNLWPIDNKTTYRLNELFYKQLTAKVDLDVALQKAKLEYLDAARGEKRLPYYWAAGIITGRSASISLPSKQTTLRWFWITGFAICLVFIAAVSWATQKGRD